MKRKKIESEFHAFEIDKGDASALDKTLKALGRCVAVEHQGYCLIVREVSGNVRAGRE